MKFANITDIDRFKNTTKTSVEDAKCIFRKRCIRDTDSFKIVTYKRKFIAPMKENFENVAPSAPTMP